MSKIKDEKTALELDPFEGDWGGESYTKLSNKLVTVRKPRPCSLCLQQAPAGEKARVMTSVYDGAVMRHTFCADCLNILVRLELGDLSADEEWFARMEEADKIRGKEETKK